MLHISDTRAPGRHELSDLDSPLLYPPKGYVDYPLLPPEGVLYELGKYARSVRLRRTAPLLFVFSGSLCFRDGRERVSSLRSSQRQMAANVPP